MAKVIHSVVTRQERSMLYQVFSNGKLVWHKQVFFGRSKALRAGGAAFREAAAEQDRMSAKEMGK